MYAGIARLGDVTGKGGRFVASPVVGHSGMARKATRQLICAGEKSLYDDASSILEALGKNVVWLGDGVGDASNLKLVINGLMASITASVATAVTICDKSGINREALENIVTGHAMNSPLIQLCLNMMYDGTHDPLFVVQHISKDVTLCAKLGESNDLECKLINAVNLSRDIQQSSVKRIGRKKTGLQFTSLCEICDAAKT